VTKKRAVEDILRDWRAAEAALPDDGSTPSTELMERIGFLRAEYEAAMAERDVEAHDLARPPGDDFRRDRGMAS
jgi:hypothetical protein